MSSLKSSLNWVWFGSKRDCCRWWEILDPREEYTVYTAVLPYLCPAFSISVYMHKLILIVYQC